MRWRPRPWLTFACLIGLPCILAGCGLASSAGGATSAAGQTPTPQPTATPGSVTLAVGAASYSTASTVQVTITNGTTTPIHFSDHQTSCTVIELQRQAGGAWSTVNVCRLKTPTLDHTLDAGTTMSVSLSPGSGWATGAYRAALHYWTGAGDASNTSVAYSAGFQIG